VIPPFFQKNGHGSDLQKEEETSMGIVGLEPTTSWLKADCSTD